MFRIGEFSKIAQVSGRLLRYYDEIGLLKPSHIDPATGYRYYLAEQLPRLNRILALKDLGLSLEQIGRLLHDNITPDEIQGMLLMKKAQIEQTVREEIGRLRQVELRLNQIQQEGKMWEHDVIVKSVPQLPYLSLREQNATSESFRPVFVDMMQALPSGSARRRFGACVFVLHSPVLDLENMDLEMGFLLEGQGQRELGIGNGRSLTSTYLPAVSQMASLVHHGMDHGMACYNALGQWVQANGLEIVGPSREVFVDMAWPSVENSLIEIQFPVQERK